MGAAMQAVRAQQSPGETIQAGDIAYETVQDDSGTCTSTVSINFLQKRFTGKPQESKKLAECSAAEAALTGMSLLIKTNMAKQMEAKKAKNKAALEMLAEKKRAAKEEREAADGEPPAKKT